MRSINIQEDIEAILTQYARCIPDVFSEFDIASVEVVFSGVDGVFDIVSVLDEDNEVVLGEIVVNYDFEAFFDIFDANTLELTEEVI